MIWYWTRDGFGLTFVLSCGVYGQNYGCIYQFPTNILYTPRMSFTFMWMYEVAEGDTRMVIEIHTIKMWFCTKRVISNYLKEPFYQKKKSNYLKEGDIKHVGEKMSM